MGNALQVGRTDTTSDLFSEGGFAARNDRWLTPLSLVRSLGHFDLDPCGAPGHDTSDEVWTPELVGDGLAMPWTGRVWLNPPYGRTMADWVRALAHCLLPGTATDRFHCSDRAVHRCGGESAMTTIPRPSKVDRIIADYEHDVAQVRARVRRIIRAVWPWVRDSAFIIGCIALVVILAWVFA